MRLPALLLLSSSIGCTTYMFVDQAQPPGPGWSDAPALPAPPPTPSDAGAGGTVAPGAGGGGADAGISAPPLGAVTSPRMGALVDGDISQATVKVRGVAGSPGESITLQQLGAPYDATGWTTVAQVTSDVQAGIGWEAGAYPFAAEFTPGSGWLQGGLLSLRALDGAGRVIGGFDHDADACFAQHPGANYPAMLAPCGSPVVDRIILTSTGPGPGAATPGPVYLNAKGALDAGQGDDYYASINAPATLGDFQQQFGFGAQGGPEVTATYFNAGDLGIGREMHCLAQTADGGVACYVRNYGTFDGDPNDALLAAVSGTGSFAAVAMTYTPGAAEPIAFMVYDANENLTTTAVLDSHGDNTSIPNTCLNCHGLNATYDPGAGHVSGASFLPFNPAGLLFAPQAGSTFSDQQGPLAALNGLIGATTPAPTLAATISALADAGVDSSGAPTVTPYVPPGWTGSPLATRTYLEAISPYCEGCHATAVGPLTFSDPANLSALAPAVISRVCGTAGDPSSHSMPVAEVPLARFWNSRARAYLVAFLQLPTPCAP